MALFGSTPWKRLPFLQLLIPLCAGILCNWYLQLPLILWIILVPLSLSGIIIFSWFPLLARFRFSPAAGIFSFIFFFATGAALCWHKDIRHQSDWIGWNNIDSVSYLLTLEETPLEKPNSFKALNDLVEILKIKNTMVVEIQGHTDNVGKDEENMKLSQDRADEVRKYLVSKGIEAARVTSKGYGPTMPVADNASDAGKAKNRRTSLKVVKE